MHSRLERLRERTNGYTVTPEQYVRVTYVALGALTVIVLTGAAVRLTGSGLGCPTWPKCYGNVYPPLNSHAVIEFSNRLLTAPVSIAAGLAWLLALRRRPYRRELTRIGALLPLGVIGQAVLGGFTVKGALDYGWVMGHFSLSMLLLIAAVVLVWRARLPDDQVHVSARGRQVAVGAHAPPILERRLVLGIRALMVLGAVVIVAGTAATAAGPHAGGSPGQKINRLDFDGRGTMDFVIHRHAEIAFLFSLLSLLLWWLVRRSHEAPRVERPLRILCMLLVLQGAVGLDQYETHLPTELVWVHVGLASLCWIMAVWATCAAGRLAPRGVQIAPQPTHSGQLAAGVGLELPGN
jgi:cytochrome c oxidase assembly protein subunit 15